MFNSGSRNQRETSQNSAPAAGKRGVFSVIGEDVTINGNIIASADLHIDGTIEGDVDCAALVQGSGSRIAGNVRAESARITGTIDGRVAVRQLTVERSARITGDVEYESIAIETGATIDGHLRHKSPGTLKLADAPAPKRGEPIQLASESA